MPAFNFIEFGLSAGHIHKANNVGLGTKIEMVLLRFYRHAGLDGFHQVVLTITRGAEQGA